MTTNVVETESTRAVVTDNPVTNIVEVTSAGPAGPPGGALTIQDQGVSEGLLTDKLNFAGSTVSVVNDTVNEIATVTVNAATPGANTNITSLGGITGGISSPDFIQFDTAAAATGAVGRMLWNDTDGTLEFQMKGGNVTLQVGQEQVLRVTNQSGATMVDGQVVYITGSTGNHLNVTLSQANSEMTSSKTLAVITETIADNQSGFATTSGLVRNFNTSALTEGEAIWLSPTVPGGLTSTKPVAPNHAVLVGWCVRQHASVGVIYVHIANGYELQELHNVLITAVANNQVLRYDSATSLWKNVTISPTVTLTGAVTGSGTMTDLGSVSIATTATADPTLTLAGDATGSATFTNLGDATLTVTVVDDSHNHIISNVDGLQDALDLKAPLASPTFTGTVTLPSTTSVGTVSATEIGYLDGVTSGIQAQIDSKLPSASYTAADVLTKIKTVDGIGSGLDADLLDGESGAYYLDFTNATNKPDPTITLSGDATGSVTLTDLASGTLSVTVVDDSHNHVISNVDGLQDALDSKLAAADYTAADVLTKIKTVDGAGSGLDADLLDGQSSAYYTAINDRLGYTAENAANKGVAGGYASLDGAGLVPSTQLPSYVDDVLEYANVAAFPATGVSGVIYVAIDTSKTYRWTGSVYVEISASPGTTDSLTEGSVNLYFTTARARQSVSAGTGISYDNSTGVITNSSPDQTVALTAGTGISTSGTYPNFTITNSAPDQTVALTAGTGISTSGAYPNFTITNSAPDQTVALTGSGTTSISGTYPNFTISSADQYVGTVTSVAAITLGTTGTDLSSSVANGSTTPVITLNVPTASASNRGALSSTDWSTFNNKQAALVSGTNIKTVNGTSLLGSGDLGTIGVAYGGTGATSLTSGYLVKGNGTSAVSASVVYDNGTNVGIGTTSPQRPLHVFYDSATVGAYSMVLQGRVGGYGAGVSLQSVLTGGSLAEMARITADGESSWNTTASTQYAGLRFYTATAGTVSEKMRLNSDGNLLVGGTTTQGAAKITITNPGAYLSLNTTTVGYTLLRGFDNGTERWSIGQIGFGGADGMAFYTGSSNTERMRIDSSGNLGVGTSSPSYKADIAGTVNTSQSFRMGASYFGSASDYAISRYLTNMVYNVPTGSGFAWGIAGGDTMILNSSGNLGIGTSSPSTLLHALGSGSELRSQNTNTAQYFSGRVRLKGPAGTYRSTALVHGNNNTGGTNTYFAIEGSDSADNYLQTLALYDYASQFWGFSTNSSEKMRIDSSGNVGIGTSSPVAKLDVAGDLIGSGNNIVGSNLYYDYSQGRWEYRANGFGGAVKLAEASVGSIEFFTASNNTSGAGAAATPNLRMVITNSGDVGVGTTAPQSKMEIRATSGGSVFNALTLSNYVGASVNTGVALYFDPNGAGSLARAASIQSVQSTSGNYADLRFFTANSDTPAERMRISANGDVTVGAAIITGSDSVGWGRLVNFGGALYVQAGSLNNGSATAQPVIFTNMYGGSERMRLDASGNLLVGTTAPLAGNTRSEIKQTLSGTWPLTLNSNDRGLLLRQSASTSGIYAYFEYNNGTNNGQISWSGGTTSYTTTSDARIKENIIDAPDAGSLIDDIRVRSWDFKADGVHWRYGMVAQELLDVVPEAVFTPEDPEKMMGVDYSKLVPMLVKELQSVRARLAQLEGK